MKRIFAAWLMISSMAPKAKSMKLRSTTGRRPFIAAPTPAATIAASEMGALRTRSRPNSLPSPRTCPQWPPRSNRSVP